MRAALLPRQAIRSCNCPQVLDLGNTEIVASWDEGEIHYKEITTQPDYGRCFTILHQLFTMTRNWIAALMQLCKSVRRNTSYTMSYQKL